ncbi:MAG: hypothetical protein WCR42_07220 [bacterium]
MKKVIILAVLACLTITLLSLGSCEEKKIPDGRFIGSWVSTDLTDTLQFKDETNFIRFRKSGFYDFFEYSYTNDSITVAYTGPMKILTRPTTHRYTLKNGQLMIDFTNECFGFESRVINYNKRNI